MNTILLAGIVLATFISISSADELDDMTTDLIAELRRKPGVDTDEVDKLEQHLARTKTGMTDLESSDSDKHAKAKTVAGAVAGELTKLLSGNGTEMLDGVLNVMMSASEILPEPAGTIVASIAGVALAILGISTEEPSMSSVMDEMFTKHLTKQKMQRLRANFWGAKRILADTRAKAIQYTIHEKAPTKVDLAILGAMLSREAPMQMLGELQSYFMEDVKKARTKQQATNALEMVKLYVKLSILNQGVLGIIRPVFAKSDLSEVEAHSIEYQIEVQMQMDRDFLRSIFEVPEPAVALAAMAYEHDPVVTKYLDTLGLDPYYSNDFMVHRQCFVFKSPFHNYMRGHDQDVIGENWAPNVDGDTDLYKMWMYFEGTNEITGYSKPMYKTVRIKAKSGDTEGNHYFMSNTGASSREDRFLDIKQGNQGAEGNFRFVFMENGKAVFSNAARIMEPFMQQKASEAWVYPYWRDSKIDIGRNWWLHWSPLSPPEGETCESFDLADSF